MSGSEPPPFSISVDDQGRRVAIAARGELDLATAPAFEEAILPVVSSGRHAVVDLRALDFMDSSGVRVIVAAHHAAGEHDGRLSLVRLDPSSPIHRVLAISGLDGVLEFVDGV